MVARTATYAVFFKTHFWDEFAQRQLARLCARVGRGDVYIVLDGTFGNIPALIAEVEKFTQLGAKPNIVVSMEDLATLGLPAITTHGSVIWYNPDYPNYVAAAQLPVYDFYVSVEYDVVINTDIDKLVDQAATDTVDYIGFPIRSRVAAWPWFDMHVDLYGPDMRISLSCFSIFSHRGLQYLLTRRQAQAKDFAAKALRYWPNNEAFIPNEIQRGGLRAADLRAYGETDLYDWWPPTNEAVLEPLSAYAFIHPVLHGTRFIRSVLYHEPSFWALLQRNGHVASRLKSFDTVMVREMVNIEISRRILAKIQRMAERLGLRPNWSAPAQSGVEWKRQSASRHNAA